MGNFPYLGKKKTKEKKEEKESKEKKKKFYGGREWEILLETHRIFGFFPFIIENIVVHGSLLQATPIAADNTN